MTEPRNGVYKYVLAAVFWLLTLYVAWTQATTRVDNKVQEVFSQVDSKVEKAFVIRDMNSNARTEMLEKRLERIEMKLDRYLERSVRRTP